MKVAFYTLGCKVNQNDTESLMQLFEEKGYEIVSFDSGADIYIINTCAVTGTGASKSRQAVRKAVGFKPQAVIVTGCYSQVAPDEIIEIPGANLIVGMAERPRIVELVEDYLKHQNGQFQQIAVDQIDNVNEWVDLPVGHSTVRTRANLKIEEGCEQFCSYCIVPYARGKVRSMPVDRVILEFERLIELGYKEVVLSGIHLGCYGKDLGIRLSELLAELLKIEGDFRIRLGSIEPNDFDEQLIAIVSEAPKVCQYLHIPLQSGSDRILKLMNRGYQTAYFKEIVARLRENNPLVGIGTDLIVGFPGETDADFDTTYDFIKELRFSNVHVFKFSPRQGTPAATMSGRVSKQVMDERSIRIHKLVQQTNTQFAQQFVGKQVQVLFEEIEGGNWTGLTSEYLPVVVTSKRNLKNCLCNVKINDYNGTNLIGEIV
ncbi:MAG TPA: tRNA (N(6)-L-threonylcarbamoyladenosine(37)-C(2))-methylthiotransferase MtaB [Bacillota bacterium]|nr:tRNA (N(6)-L-threonylcarbamoyladenosine(37)-C(2))-methylthiotransferase MtaB [Bacillota bacterium]HOL09409.1 tRNA (N(6)-L-threonylcarbamoyladenosine(37)-C(2))-methylthiotransferase MtaB [Bacillota bacterium]HPO97133.1 tRNA (N(6)-L-threonylcarbamoyladenosine(37)-C(2))-methylthiotransferase MtaB [Bacillota bacterium]